MATCIICHLDIIEGVDSFQECPNGHPTHTDCLKEWLLHSSNCPLCREPYSSHVIEGFKDFIQQKEQEKQEALESELKQKKIKQMGKIAEKMIFLKFVESIEVLLDAKEYEYALSRLDLHGKDTTSNQKSQNLMFLKGKINYLKGRYDMAINLLTKLVKDKYDYPEGFLYLGKSYEALGLKDQAKWAYDRVN
jgi:tetratricopeptide (TPR) repeat protein